MGDDGPTVHFRFPSLSQKRRFLKLSNINLNQPTYKASDKNLTSPFCSRDSIIPSRQSLKKKKLFTREKTKSCKQAFISVAQLQNRSYYVLQRTRTIVKCTQMKSVQNHCFSLLNMHIFDVVVAVDSNRDISDHVFKIDRKLQTAVSR